MQTSYFQRRAVSNKHGVAKRLFPLISNRRLTGRPGKQKSGEVHKKLGITCSIRINIAMTTRWIDGWIRKKWRNCNLQLWRETMKAFKRRNDGGGENTKLNPKSWN